MEPLLAVFQIERLIRLVREAHSYNYFIEIPAFRQQAVSLSFFFFYHMSHVDNFVIESFLMIMLAFMQTMNGFGIASIL